MVIKILLGLLILSIIVLVHEFGHFIMAKQAGIGVKEFCLGLGPTIASFNKGETKYSLKLLPIGGACIMQGEDEESDDEKAFGNKSIGKRMAVVLGGPLFNFILSFICAIIVISIAGVSKPILSDVSKGYPAEKVGLMAGDEIKKVNDKKVVVFRDFFIALSENKGEEVEVVYVRDGEEKTVSIKPQLQDGRYLLGIVGSPRQKVNPIEAIKYGAYEVKTWVKLTFDGLGKLISGRMGKDEIAGPVGIANIIGDSYESSKDSGILSVVLSLMNIVIPISVNLGIMNLLPLPALDGGRFLFLIIELIKGKPLKKESEGFVHFIGFVLLMLLMIFVFYNDISKLITG